MTNYRVYASRDEDWWGLTVEGGGLDRPFPTQAKRLDQAESMARNLIALVLDVDENEIGDIEIIVDLDGRLSDELADTRRLREETEKARTEVTRRSRELALQLRERGLTMRDIGTLLGITHQAARKLLTT